MKKVSINDFHRQGGHQLVLDRVEFKTHGSLRGEEVGSYFGTGILPDEHVAQIRADKPTYVIYSYVTPIAWHGERGWVMPDVKYSVTTSKQQGRIAHALHTEEVKAA